MFSSSLSSGLILLKISHTLRQFRFSTAFPRCSSIRSFSLLAWSKVVRNCALAFSSFRKRSWHSLSWLGSFFTGPFRALHAGHDRTLLHLSTSFLNVAFLLFTVQPLPLMACWNSALSTSDSSRHEQDLHTHCKMDRTCLKYPMWKTGSSRRMNPKWPAQSVSLPLQVAHSSFRSLMPSLVSKTPSGRGERSGLEVYRFRSVISRAAMSLISSSPKILNSIDLTRCSRGAVEAAEADSSRVMLSNVSAETLPPSLSLSLSLSLCVTLCRPLSARRP